MREIKFRVWHAGDGVMYAPFDLRQELSPEASDNTWGTGNIFLEYTGLKDKNGDKEVYECDILDSEGNIIGNQYETSALLEDKTNLLIQGFGTKDWFTTYQEAVARGCHDA